MKEYRLKNDKYRKARGGCSRFLKIFCKSCDSFILLYQKDGPGPLKRLYMDRIFEPKELTNLQKLPLKEISNLLCALCKNFMGTPMIYKKEHRKSFNLQQGSFYSRLDKCC